MWVCHVTPHPPPTHPPPPSLVPSPSPPSLPHLADRLDRNTDVFCNGAQPPISHVWGKATYFARFLEFHSKPKEALPRTRRRLRSVHLWAQASCIPSEFAFVWLPPRRLCPARSASTAMADSSTPLGATAGPSSANADVPAIDPEKNGKAVQEHKHLRNYCSEELWAIISCDKTVTLETKLSAKMSNPGAYPGIMLCEVNQIRMQKFGTTLLTGLQMHGVDMQKDVLLLRSQNTDAVGSSEARDAA